MECKYVQYMGGVKMAIELIDTLWNVNSSKLITYFFASFELIDTLWNVNDEDYEFLQEQYEN